MNKKTEGAKSVTEAKASTKIKVLDVGFLTMKLMNGLPRFASLPFMSYDEERAAWAILRESGRVEVGRSGNLGAAEDQGGLDFGAFPSWIQNMLMDVVEGLRRSGMGRDLWPDWNRPEVMLSAVRRVIEVNGMPNITMNLQGSGRFTSQMMTYTFHAAFPSSRMPTAIRLHVEELVATKEYGPVHVAWEAAWQEVLKLTVGASARPAGEPLDPIAFAKHIPSGKYHVLGTWDLTQLESYIVSEFTL